jgi:hypothetical protein
MNAHILLVEGTCGTGKSTLIKSLLGRHIAEEDRPRTLVHLSQGHTYFPLASTDLPAPPGKRACREHMRRLLRMIDLPDVPDLRPSRWFTFFGLVDTLHLTQAFRPGVLSWAELAYVDRFLAERGARMIFLRASPATLWSRLILERGAAPGYLSLYQRKYGATPEGVHAYYLREQAEMEAFAKKSRIDVLFLDSEESVAALAGEAYGFWKG